MSAYIYHHIPSLYVHCYLVIQDSANKDLPVLASLESDAPGLKHSTPTWATQATRDNGSLAPLECEAGLTGVDITLPIIHCWCGL